ncbi:histone H4-like TAF Taf6, SAGA complex subunit [Malassezia pachydermatis]
MALATDIEYRIRDIVQSASKYMKHAKRSRMTTSDIDNALRQKNIEPLYGFFPPYTGGKKQVPWFRSIPTPSGTPLYVTEDEEIDFDKILENGPRVGVGRGVGWHAHWLAIEGIQPPIPENPVFLARKAAIAEEALPDTVEAAADLGNVAVKPLVKHVLSRELQLYYERLTSSILSPPADAKATDNATLPDDAKSLSEFAQISSGNLVRDAALASLRGDAGIHQLVPYLIQWVGSNVTHALRASSQAGGADTDATQTIQLLHTMLSTLHALLINPSIFIEPYLHQLLPSVLSILLGSYFGSSDNEKLETLAMSLRVYAASLLVYVVDRFADSYPTLKSRLVATLLQALVEPMDDGTASNALEASGSVEAKLGALVGLRKLGPSSFKTLLGPIGVLTGTLSTQDAELIPIQVMGDWLGKTQQSEQIQQWALNRLVEEVKTSLAELGKDAKSTETINKDQLKERFSAFWVDTLPEDLLLVLTHYQSVEL